MTVRMASHPTALAFSARAMAFLVLLLPAPATICTADNSAEIQVGKSKNVKVAGGIGKWRRRQ